MIAIIVTETDMMGLHMAEVVDLLLEEAATMIGMVLHHPDSSVVHLQVMVVVVVAFPVAVTSHHPIQEIDGVDVPQDVMMVLQV